MFASEMEVKGNKEKRWKKLFGPRGKNIRWSSYRGRSGGEKNTISAWGP